MWICEEKNLMWIGCENFRCKTACIYSSISLLFMVFTLAELLQFLEIIDVSKFDIYIPKVN
jgi:hypothetical protein